MGSLNPLWHGLISYFKTRGGDTFSSFKILKKPLPSSTETNNVLYESPNTQVFGTTRSDNLKSKLWYPEFFQKMNEQIRFYYHATWFFFVFWKKLKTPKRHIKIM